MAENIDNLVLEQLRAIRAEMAKMAENKLMYDTLVQLINKKMGIMKYAINSEK